MPLSFLGWTALSALVNKLKDHPKNGFLSSFQFVDLKTRPIGSVLLSFHLQSLSHRLYGTYVKKRVQNSESVE
ncbi:hypothetical protein LEP1GSC193_0530 [Leptospira alstonii serovar Pingchang str. 80-412]|uniref:Uncharacterized protein n=2 Tax=Leptospira alstonii TaxID=28452 RepID=M6D3L8_9LEPT|nr:hypothetical protein LEP1GSC194_3370 [Leptospira alstonii serovar Sichuan str. 79601]EQA79477.1 hypothetical protein LEP1GSC193_0530 [Leptospira alstonii serovar Pingchang str. 80-412]